MRNSDNYNYDYAHKFFGEDIQYNALYWYIIYRVLCTGMTTTKR